jgi:hypothetical protein
VRGASRSREMAGHRGTSAQALQAAEESGDLPPRFWYRNVRWLINERKSSRLTIYEQRTNVPVAFQPSPSADGTSSNHLWLSTWCELRSHNPKTFDSLAEPPEEGSTGSAESEPRYAEARTVGGRSAKSDIRASPRASVAFEIRLERHKRIKPRD